MITALDCFRKYGDPLECEKKFIRMWDVPADLEIGVIPKKIYCNEDLVLPLIGVFTELIKTGLVKELKTWDGCLNRRVIRGYEKKHAQLITDGKFEEANRLMSIHSWAIAVDVNAFENQLNMVPKLTPEFVKCWTTNGFDYGGYFKRKDGMHFQLSSI